MLEHLDTIIANLLALTALGAFAFFRTAVWRRARTMRRLAYELDCDYSPNLDSLLDRYHGFLNLQTGLRPTVVNVLTRQDGDVSVCIFDLHYYHPRNFGYARNSSFRRRTIIALTRSGMTLPQFYIRPEGITDKLRETFSGATAAIEQFKEGLHTVTGERLTELGEHINRPPNVNDWINRDEIKLAHAPEFSDSHWIKSHNEEAARDFLTRPITNYIGGEPGLIWEGFDSTFLLSGAKIVISHKEISSYVNVAQEFINTAIASSQANSEQLIE